MANLTIRNLDEATKRALRIRAAQHGISMEEARRILRSAVGDDRYPARLGSHLQARFQKVADDAFDLPCPNSRCLATRLNGTSLRDPARYQCTIRVHANESVFV